MMKSECIRLRENIFQQLFQISQMETDTKSTSQETRRRSSNLFRFRPRHNWNKPLFQTFGRIHYDCIIHGRQFPLRGRSLIFFI